MRNVKVLVSLSNNTYVTDSRSDDRLFCSILFLISKRSPAKIAKIEPSIAMKIAGSLFLHIGLDHRRQPL